MTCFNFRVTGGGTATPKGARFPGAYSLAEPGFHYDLRSNDSYPSVGPAVYKSQYDVRLEPKDRVIVSPTNQGLEADEAYYRLQQQVIKDQGRITSYFEGIGG